MAAGAAVHDSRMPSRFIDNLQRHARPTRSCDVHDVFWARRRKPGKCLLKG